MIGFLSRRGWQWRACVLLAAVVSAASGAPALPGGSLRHDGAEGAMPERRRRARPRQSSTHPQPEDVWLWGVARAWGIAAQGRLPFQRGLRNILLDRAAARALPSQGWEQALPEHRSPGDLSLTPLLRQRARALALLMVWLAAAAVTGATVGVLAPVVAAGGVGTGGAQLRPRGRGEGGFAATRVGEASNPGPRDGNEPPPLRLPSAETPLRPVRPTAAERGNSRSARRRDRPRSPDRRRRASGVPTPARQLGPHFADMELHTPSPMDQDAGVPLGELRRAAARSDAAAEASPSDEELLPGTPPASGRGRRRLDMDGGAAAAVPLGREGAPEEPGEEPPAPPPVPAADGEARRVRRRVTQAGRLFCPVPGCPCADSGSAAGWASLQSLVGHVNVHLSGVLQGTVPAEWMQEHGRARCRVCGLCVAAGRGVHPTCRPAERAQAPGGTGSDDAAADQDVLPPLEEVMAQYARTAKHVPKACRDQWARALTRALAAVVAYNTTAAWTELIMLPKAVLGPPPRGGRKNTRAAATFTADRLSRWLDGDKHELWREVCASPAPARPGPATAAHNRRRAEALTREGFDRKACAALLSKGVCEDTAQVVETLRQLHPQAPHPVCPPLAELPLAADITASSVERVLRTFPRDSAAGPSGTRVQHFVEALTPGHCTPVLEQLTAVVQLLARGGAPPDVAPYLAGASLMALPKEWRDQAYRGRGGPAPDYGEVPVRGGPGGGARFLPPGPARRRMPIRGGCRRPRGQGVDHAIPRRRVKGPPEARLQECVQHG